MSMQTPVIDLFFKGTLHLILLHSGFLVYYSWMRVGRVCTELRKNNIIKFDIRFTNSPGSQERYI